MLERTTAEVNNPVCRQTWPAGDPGIEPRLQVLSVATQASESREAPTSLLHGPSEEHLKALEGLPVR